MPRLIDTLGNTIGHLTDSMTDSIKDKLEDIDKPIIIDIKGITRAGSDCYNAAKDTSELCITTIERAKEMVSFGDEIKSTLSSFATGGGVNADTFQTIQDLVDGDQVKAATALAADMDKIALECVDKSVKMIESMERGVDALPDFVESRVENKMDAAAEKGARDGDPEFPNVDQDVRELQERIREVDSVNLFTVMKSGVHAFTSLAQKGDLIKTLFTTIKDFAGTVLEVTESIRNYEVGSMMGKWRDLVKDLWRVLRLSSLIKAFAQAIGRLIKFIIKLFKKASEKLGQIWKALAHAKDIMADCVHYVMDAMKLCDDAKDRSTQLVDTSEEIQGHLENVTSLRKSGIASIRDLVDGDEIRLAIELATSLDDILLACIGAIVKMVKKVIAGVKSLPDVLKEGVPNDAGKKEDDPPPANSTRDVQVLEKCRGDIESADAVGVINASKEGISRVKEEVGICQDMIIKSRGFATDCNGTIESFLGEWDLENAMSNLLQMYRLASLGEMIEQWATEAKKLVKAIIAVIIAARDKIKNIDFIPDEIEEKVSELIPDEIEDKVGELAAGVGRLFKRR
jgi:hypothetical protein